MAGTGATANEIAGDPEIRSTPMAVYLMLRRYGIALSDAPCGNLSVELRGKRLLAFEGEARKRRRTPEALAGVVLRILAEDTTLLANVLDDEA